MAHVGEELGLETRRLHRLGMRDRKIVLDPLPLGDVVERDHRPRRLTGDRGLVDDRKRGIFRGERAAVASPHHLGRDPATAASVHRFVDRAVDEGDHRAVSPIGMEERVRELAHDVGDVDSERARCGGVHERATPVGIDAVDAFTRRLEEHAQAVGEPCPLDVGRDVVAAELIGKAAETHRARKRWDEDSRPIRLDARELNLARAAQHHNCADTLAAADHGYGHDRTGASPVAEGDGVLTPGFGVQITDEDLTGMHRATARRVADHDRLLDTRMTVHDAQTARVEETDDDPLSAEQLGDVGQEPRVQDLRLLDAPTEPINSHALPRRQELCELIDLVAQRDPGSGPR